MRVLIVKTSSLGDIIHTFPALTDASHAIKNIQFDWVVEEEFTQIPAWHTAVDQVMPSASRRWRNALWKTWRMGVWKRFVQRLQAREYDAVIDAQGLIKSALITRKALGKKYGLDKQSAREPLASRFYDHRYRIDKQQHAIQRTRQLFSQALGYSLDELPLQYGLSIEAEPSIKNRTILFLHGTTWASKRWPMSFWSALAKDVIDAGYQVLIPAGNEEEKMFAETLAAEAGAIQVVAGKSLSEMAAMIKAVSGVVSVDTGLAHLAAAIEVPTVALYGATDARLTGVLGEQQTSLQASIDCSPCLQRVCPKLSDQSSAPPCTDMLPASEVWQALQAKL